MTIEDKELDRLLQQCELQPPAGFTDKVLQQIPIESVSSWQPARTVAGTSLWKSIAQWIGLLVGAALGVSQCLYFVLGLWITTAVG
jgi:hypothetical protein